MASREKKTEKKTTLLREFKAIIARSSLTWSCGFVSGHYSSSLIYRKPCAVYFGPCMIWFSSTLNWSKEQKTKHYAYY